MTKMIDFLNSIDPSIMERVESLDLSEVERDGLIKVHYDLKVKGLSELREKKLEEIKSQFPEMESLGIFLFVKTGKKGNSSGTRDTSSFPYYELDSGEKLIPNSILNLFGSEFHRIGVERASEIFEELGVSGVLKRVSKNGNTRKELGIIDFQDSEYFKECENLRQHPEFQEIKKSLVLKKS